MLLFSFKWSKIASLNFFFKMTSWSLCLFLLGENIIYFYLISLPIYKNNSCYFLLKLKEIFFFVLTLYADQIPLQEILISIWIVASCSTYISFKWPFTIIPLIFSILLALHRLIFTHQLPNLHQRISIDLHA